MSAPNRFDLVLQALAELAPEMENLQTDLGPALPTLTDVLSDLGPLPREALFLGIAEDGLPVLLDVNDPSPGPLLVVGDSRAGKTALLQTIARASAKIHTSEEVQFGVITSQPDAWHNEINLPNNAGIYPVHDNTASDFILSLTAWAHSNRGTRQAVLLLIDDLDRTITQLEFEARQNLRWLLLRGPNRRVWPITTLNAAHHGKALEWLDAFRTRIFGRIRHIANARELTKVHNIDLQDLLAGTQFTLREGSNWLNFWIPAMDAE